MTDFSKLLIQRRSIRDYEDRPVPIDLVKELIGRATMAPSSGNGQPWSFIIIGDKDLIRRLSDESKKNLVSDMAARADHPSRRYEALLTNKDFNVFFNAPCLVFITGPPALPSARVDCALFAAYFMLAASDRGLGTCWVNLGSQIRDPMLKEEIGLPEDRMIVAPVIIGWPGKIPQPPARNEPRILKVIEG